MWTDEQAIASEVHQGAAADNDARRYMRGRRASVLCAGTADAYHYLARVIFVQPESLHLRTPVYPPFVPHLLSTPGQQSSIVSHDDQLEADRLIHSRYAEQRTLWLDAMRPNYAMHTMACRLETCGRNAWVEHNQDNGQFRIVADGCKLRFCPRCSGIFAKRCRERINSWTEKLQTTTQLRLKMVTLTMKHTRAPLQHQVKHLRQSFRRLRQRSLWKNSLSSGIGVMQITYNADDDTWHPHLHVLCHGKFIPQAKLTEAWKHASGGSTIVDIRAVRDVTKVVDYVTRYISRPIDFNDKPPPERLVEFIGAIKGARLLIAFGDVPKAPKPPASEEVWTYVNSLAYLVYDAKRGGQKSAAVLACLRAAPDTNADDDEDALFSEPTSDSS